MPSYVHGCWARVRDAEINTEHLLLARHHLDVGRQGSSCLLPAAAAAVLYVTSDSSLIFHIAQCHVSASLLCAK